MSPVRSLWCYQYVSVVKGLANIKLEQSLISKKGGLTGWTTIQK